MVLLLPELSDWSI